MGAKAHCIESKLIYSARLNLFRDCNGFIIAFLHAINYIINGVQFDWVLLLMKYIATNDLFLCVQGNAKQTGEVVQIRFYIQVLINRYPNDANVRQFLQEFDQ